MGWAVECDVGAGTVGWAVRWGGVGPGRGWRVNGRSVRGVGLGDQVLGGRRGCWKGGEEEGGAWGVAERDGGGGERFGVKGRGV